jgi:hypothetical protein
MFISNLFSGFGGLETGRTTGDEILARFGKPAEEWHNEDGTATWEYPQGPEGTTCHMLTVDAGHVLLEVEQVLAEAYFARIAPGWTHDRVRRLLGRPRSTTFFPHQREEVWDWRIASTLPSSRMLFNVHFDEFGAVTRTSRSEESLQVG